MQIKYLSLGLIAAVAVSVLADPIVNSARVAGAGDAVIKREPRDLRIAKIYANAIRRRYTRRSEVDEEEDEEEEEEDEEEEDEPDEDEANESESQSLSRREEEKDEEEAEEDEPDEDENPNKASANAATPRLARR
ncbi:hypothetical protein RMCBS344292_03768 [Rhizopus microsporus]|nr:hypothetical protein RMCBS344292_03768 [Rhizopus microsporus]